MSYNIAQSPKHAVRSVVSKVDTQMQLYLVTRAPYTLPDIWKKRLISIVPFLNLLLICAHLYTIPASLFLVFSVYPLNQAASGWWGAYALAGVIAQLVLGLSAAKGLFAQKRSAWWVLWSIVMVRFVLGILQFDWVNTLVESILIYYLLYQIKAEYR